MTTKKQPPTTVSNCTFIGRQPTTEESASISALAAAAKANAEAIAAIARMASAPGTTAPLLQIGGGA